MAGLLGVEEQTRNRAIGGLEKVAAMEEERNRANRAIKTAETNQNLGMTASGAGLGFAIGGPIGAGVGATAGFLLSKIF